MIARPRPQLVNQSVYPHSPNDRIELLALGDHHADTGNHHVDDPVAVVIFADTPVCVDGRPAAWPANSCPDDDVLYPGHPFRDDDEGLTRIPLEPGGVCFDDILCEKVEIRGALGIGGGPPVTTEYKAADVVEIEPGLQQFAETGGAVCLRYLFGAEHGNCAVADFQDEPGLSASAFGLSPGFSLPVILCLSLGARGEYTGVHRQCDHDGNNPNRIS